MNLQLVQLALKKILKLIYHSFCENRFFNYEHFIPNCLLMSKSEESIAITLPPGVLNSSSILLFQYPSKPSVSY